MRSSFSFGKSKEEIAAEERLDEVQVTGLISTAATEDDLSKALGYAIDLAERSELSDPSFVTYLLELKKRSAPAAWSDEVDLLYEDFLQFTEEGGEEGDDSDA